MKALQYLFLGIAKFIGPIWFFILPVHFRKYARNVVYNYVLQNNKRDRLKRLWERNPTQDEYGWRLRHGVTTYRDVGAIEFWLVFVFLYLWLDDDSVSDTYDDGHCRTFMPGGERESTVYAWLFGRWLDVPMEDDSKAFDYGDDITPRFKFIPALIWQLRNTSMNFKYYFMDY